jgi:hypothetical protein
MSESTFVSTIRIKLQTAFLSKEIVPENLGRRVLPFLKREQIPLILKST